MKDLEITDIEQLWTWLAAHHGQSQSVRLITWKAAHVAKYVSRDAVLAALISHGWIDGRRFTVDADRTAQLIAPRQQQAWSKSYKDLAEKLVREGRMHPAGQGAIDASKAADLWDFFADVDALIVPDDLAAEIDSAIWEALAHSYRRNVLRWIKLAKTPGTRRKRIGATAQATARGEKLPQM
ncbi:MAG: YdeI/OmpD-associated family protein [Pseudomonadota bacterium]